MLLTVLAEDHIRFELDAHDELNIAGAPFGALQMLAASLALCTAAVLLDYATTAQVHLHGLALDVRWHYAERPRRISEMQLTLRIGPELPPNRHAALLRAAEHCTVHATLTHGARITTHLEVADGQQA